jgi:hypothetical protein
MFVVRSNRSPDQLKLWVVTAGEWPARVDFGELTVEAKVY